MSRVKPLHISIPAPCSQNWEEMSPTERGRFCSHCKKTVIDFSYLSDTELYQYFQDHTNIACGRFNPLQVNTAILPAKHHNSYWKKFYKPIAAMLAFLSMKYSGAAMSKKELPVTVSPSSKKIVADVTGDKVIISGTVRDDMQTPLENVEIRLNDVEVARTNKEGRYEFEFKIDPKAKTYILSAILPGMTKVVRNYHPAMLSATYDIMMYPLNYTNSSIMGGISTEITGVDTTAICFKKGTSAITDEMADALAKLATRMRNRPEVWFDIVSYTANSPEQAIGKKRQHLIKQFIVEKEGIDTTRLRLVTRPASAAMKNTIEIVPKAREF